jgi:hypothetical protein
LHRVTKVGNGKSRIGTQVYQIPECFPYPDSLTTQETLIPHSTGLQPLGSVSPSPSQDSCIRHLLQAPSSCDPLAATRIGERLSWSPKLPRLGRILPENNTAMERLLMDGAVQISTGDKMAQKQTRRHSACKTDEV